MNRLSTGVRRHGLLAAILIVAAVARLWGIGFGLPHPLCRPDEDSIASVATGFFLGDFNPRFFNYPSFFMAVVAAGLAVYFRVGRRAGWFHSREHFLQAVSPTGMHMTARLLSAAAGTANVWVVYRSAHRLFDRQAALVGASFLALAFLHVRDSHFGVTDVAATFLISVSFLSAVRLAESGATRDVLAAAVGAGLASSTKYNAALIVLPTLWVLAVGEPARLGPLISRLRKTSLFGAVAIAAFVAASPYSVLAYREFLGALAYEAAHLAGGHGAIVGRGWVVHLTSSLRYGVGTPLLVAGVCGLALLAWRQPRKAVLVGIFPVVYYALIGSGFTVFARYILPVVPFLCMTAAYAVTAVGQGVGRRCGRPAWGVAVTWALAAAVIAPSARSVFQFDRLIGREDNRLLAARWIEEQFPGGAILVQVGPAGGHVFLATRNAERSPRYLTIEPGAAGVSPDAVVVQISPIDPPSPLPDEIRQLLTGFELRHVFRAFNPGIGGNIYDRQDEFYLPLGGFEAIERPGPNLEIYTRR